MGETILPDLQLTQTHLREIQMDIFVFDTDNETCALYQCDKHVVKMILESVQILRTALNRKAYVTPYESTHHIYTPVYSGLKSRKTIFAG